MTSVLNYELPINQNTFHIIQNYISSINFMLIIIIFIYKLVFYYVKKYDIKKICKIL